MVVQYTCAQVLVENTVVWVESNTCLLVQSILTHS